MVLSDFLHADPLEFQQTLKEWPADLYDIDKIIPAVQDKVCCVSRPPVGFLTRIQTDGGA
jgi:hypothetical protein